MSHTTVMLSLLAICVIPAQAVRQQPQLTKIREDTEVQASCVETLRPMLRGMRYKELFEAAMDWWFGGSSQESEYERQWKTSAGKEKVLPGSNLTWGDMNPKKSGKGYVFERKRLTMMGRLEDSGRYIVVNSTVRDVCDASTLFLRFLTHGAPLLEAVRELLPEDSACAGKSLTELATAAGDALSAECFNSCLGTLKENVRDLECKRGVLTEDFYTQVVDADDQCAGMPVDNLEKLAKYAMRLKCLTFTSPHPLFFMKDKAPGQISQLPGEAPVCGLPEEYSTTRDKTRIVQNGTCPEGSKCKCPMTSLRSRQTAMEIRMDKGLDMFAKDGAASLPVITKQYSMGLIISTVVVQMGINGLAASAAIAATMEAPTFLLMGTIKLSVTALYNYIAHSCADTLGCWPQAPEKVSVEGTPNACRLPSKAEEGGSPVWFLPPPMLRIKHSKGQCTLDTCKVEDYINQTVGFGRSENDVRYEGKPNVYNCQALAFEDMTNGQRLLLLQRLQDSGISKEYDISGPLKKYQSLARHANTLIG